jgi:eukaryotic-like serine/threonine-protein kinase
MRDPDRLTQDLWLYDADGEQGERLTFDPADEFAPVWSPDGTRLLFSAAADGAVNLLIKNVSSAAPPASVKADALGLGRYAADWSRRGGRVLYVAGGRAISRSDVWTTSVDGRGAARPLLESKFIETQPRFSPDGDWFVYSSNETGRFEVYADRSAQGGSKRRISTDGGAWPRWSRDGRELFYVALDSRLMTVPVRVADRRLDVREPTSMFVLPPRQPGRLDAYPYDVSPDRQRILVNTAVEDESADTITVVLNWAPPAQRSRPTR